MKRRLNILYVAAELQHPTMRGALRQYHFMRILSRDHSVTLLALANTEVTPAAREETASYAKQALIFSSERDLSPAAPQVLNLARSLAKRLRSQKVIREMKAALSALMEEESFDLVLLWGKKLHPLIENIHGLPIVTDFCDATTMRQRQRLRYVRGIVWAWRLYRYAHARRVERKMLKLTPHLAFISARDRDAVVGSESTAAVIPNGIDLDYWARTMHHSQRNCIIFTGVMNYPPNEDAALYLIETILPRLRVSVPNLEVLIVGRDPTAALRTAARNAANVTVSGYVEDMRPYLERATVFAAPIRFASGLQNKILEALAMEVPVVTTSITAAGLRVEGASQPPLEIADEAGEFGARILSLLRDPEKQSRMAAEGRRFVQIHFDWDRATAMLETLCVQAVDERSSRRDVGATLLHTE